MAVAFHHFVILTPPWWFRRPADSDLCTVMYSVHMCCTYVNCLCLARLTWFWHDLRPGIVLNRPPPMCAGCAPIYVYVDVEQWEAKFWKVLGRRSIVLQTFWRRQWIPNSPSLQHVRGRDVFSFTSLPQGFWNFLPHTPRQHSVNVVAMVGSRIATYNGNSFKCISAAKIIFGFSLLGLTFI